MLFCSGMSHTITLLVWSHPCTSSQAWHKLTWLRLNPSSSRDHDTILKYTAGDILCRKLLLLRAEILEPGDLCNVSLRAFYILNCGNVFRSLFIMPGLQDKKFLPKQSSLSQITEQQGPVSPDPDQATIIPHSALTFCGLTHIWALQVQSYFQRKTYTHMLKHDTVKA